MTEHMSHATPGTNATPAATGPPGTDATPASSGGVGGPKGTVPAAYDDHHHADVSGGWLRPAVFGAMDGLVTNIALISGVGGGGGSRHIIVLTGVAGLVAGAISMGLGEYTSVRTQNDQVASEVAKERAELERHPAAEAEELAQRWIGRGLPPELARQVAAAVAENPEEALRVHAQEELGVNPHVIPSPWIAAISSFLCFSIGAVIPLLPYLFGFNNLWPALIVGGCGLFLAGALTARFTKQRWWVSGLRQLVLGGAAAAATYGIGHLVGISGVG
jgi:VIT1/CCC1 family predicted Fe2+/Mn2+ transporter